MTVATTRKCNTPYATLSYPVLTDSQLARAKARSKPNKDGTMPKVKFSVTLIFAPGEDINPMRAAAVLAVTEKFGANIKVGQKTYTAAEALEKGIIRSPFRTDTEEKGYPEGSTFIAAKTETKPGIVNRELRPMTDAEVEEMLYAGSQGRGVVTFYGYDVSGNKGIGVAMDALQHIGDGDRLDNRTNATEAFTALDSAPADISSLVG